MTMTMKQFCSCLPICMICLCLLSGLGRLAAPTEFLASFRAVAGPIASPALAVQLLRAYWSSQAGPNTNHFSLAKHMGYVLKASGSDSPSGAGRLHDEMETMARCMPMLAGLLGVRKLAL